MNTRLSTKVRARLMGHSLDRRLLEGAPPELDEAVKARVARVLAPSYRHRIATGLRRITEIAHDPRPQTQASHAPIQRHDVLEAEDDLLELADDLDKTEDARARGVIMASELVSNGTSPVYAPKGVSALRAAISHAHAALFLG